jgi:uncharacterized membrane protein HdeD (DUF308 family)
LRINTNDINYKKGEKFMMKINEWWIPTLVGIILIFMGLFFMLQPKETFMVLTAVFGWLIFTIGGFNTVFALRNRNYFEGWYIYLIIGLLEAVLGAIMLFQPELSATSIIMFAGFWLTFIAIARISLAFWLKKAEISNWWLSLLSGIIMLFFSILILINPVIGMFSIVYLISIPIIMAGLLSLLFGLQLKQFNNNF